MVHNTACSSSGNVHTCPPVNHHWTDVVKWKAGEYIHPSYNKLNRVSSLQVPELTSAMSCTTLQWRFQHSRDTTSKHTVDLTETSSAFYLCLRWLEHFVPWVLSGNTEISGLTSLNSWTLPERRRQQSKGRFMTHTQSNTSNSTCSLVEHFLKCRTT